MDKKKQIDQDMLSVESAFLHQAIQVPGTPLGMEKSLNDTRIPGLKLAWSSHLGGLIIKIKDKIAFVPSANIASIIFVKKDQEF